jgi:hypothetical protein
VRAVKASVQSEEELNEEKNSMNSNSWSVHIKVSEPGLASLTLE